jgi:hypothetical protein
MAAQRIVLIFAPEHSAILQDRHDPVSERRERGWLRDEEIESVGGTFDKPAFDLGCDSLRRADERMRPGKPPRRLAQGQALLLSRSNDPF